MGAAHGQCHRPRARGSSGRPQARAPRGVRAEPGATAAGRRTGRAGSAPAFAGTRGEWASALLAREDAQALCERIFATFLAPLVLGGPMRPGKPIGGKNALGIGDHRTPSNVGLLSRTGLARVRTARKLAPVDTFDPAPNAHEWALASVL